MIKKLRWKFVLINMSLILIVLMGLLAVIYATTEANLRKEAEKSMRQMLDSGKQNQPGLHIGERPGGTPLGKEGKPLDTSALTTFLIRVDPLGELETEGRFETVPDPGVLEELVRTVLQQEETQGRVEYSGVEYDYLLRHIPEGGVRIALHERSDEIYQLEQLFWKLLGAGAAGMLAFLAISVFLAGRAVRPIAQSLEQQRRFVADASHELKTPLSVIMANVGVVMAHPEKTVQEESRWLSYIQEEGAQMSELVGNLLYLAKSDDGTLQNIFEPVNLSDIVWEELLHFESRAFESGVKLTSDIDGDLYVLGDGSQLKRMIGNLMENGIKYSGEEGQVQVELHRMRDKAQLSVHNTGQILTQEQMTHVFERFYRTDGARSRNVGGYGLGLSIVQAIVLDHKGKITVQSAEGEGTQFVAVLPLLHGQKSEEKK